MSSGSHKRGRSNSLGRGYMKRSRSASVGRSASASRMPTYSRARITASAFQRVGPSVRHGPAVQHSTPMLKSVDLAGPVTSQISNAANFILTNAVQTGAGFFNRIGSRITLKSLHLVGQITPGTGSPTGVSEYLRIMVVYDKQANGATPNIADLLQDQNQTAATVVTNAWSHLNMVNRDRFQILMDDRVEVPINTFTAEFNNISSIIDYTGEVNINRFIRLNDLETMFKSSSSPTTQADISVGALYVVTFGTLSAATSGFAFNFNARLRYWDC